MRDSGRCWIETLFTPETFDSVKQWLSNSLNEKHYVYEAVPAVRCVADNKFFILFTISFEKQEDLLLFKLTWM